MSSVQSQTHLKQVSGSDELLYIHRNLYHSGNKIYESTQIILKTFQNRALYFTSTLVDFYGENKLRKKSKWVVKNDNELTNNLSYQLSQ